MKVKKILVLAGASLALAYFIKKREVYCLSEENSRLRGQLGNMWELNKGLMRSIERVSYINGKISAKLEKR